MSGLSALLSSSIGGYLPAAVKDAAGLCPKISDEVRHITWLSVERVFWPPNDVVRLMLVVGYTDGFQIWDLQDPAAVHEVCSKQDKAVAQARMLPMPVPSASKDPGAGGSDGDDRSLGITAAPLMAYVHKAAPALVRLFSLKQHDDVHLLRLTEAARTLQASRRFFAVGFARRVELYDALSFQALFSVDVSAAAGPSFALGQRWLAYNLPPQQPSSAPGPPGSGLAAGLGGSKQLQTAVMDGLRMIGQNAQRTLDNMLMPPPEGSEHQASAPSAARGGVVAVRDAANQRIIARFEDHTEPVEAMAWDPSGLQLVTAAALGHRVLVHRALLGAEHALVTHDADEGGLALGSVVFQHLYTLSRGYTPAVISDISVSDDGQLVAVSSAKGTSHVFRLPPLHSAAGLGRHRHLERGAVKLAPATPSASSCVGDVGIGLSLGAGGAAPRPIHLSACTRVRLGHSLLQEGLMPKCTFSSAAHPSTSSRSVAQPREAHPRMYVATRTGSLMLYSLNPGASQSVVGAEGSTGAAANSTAGAGAGSEGSAAAAGGGRSAGAEGGRGGSGGGGCVEGGASSEVGEWQTQLLKEVHFCRPLRHFTERRLPPQDLRPSVAAGGAAGLAAPGALGGIRRGSSSGTSAVPAEVLAAASPCGSPLLGPRASPSLGPRPSPASPLLGPRSPGLAPCQPGSPPPPEEGTGGAAAAPAQGQGCGGEASRWLQHVELTTHMPTDVPVWLCPSLSFHAYSSGLASAQLNAALRAGRAPPGRRRLAVTRLERPGDSVSYDGGSSPADFSHLFGGALGASVGAPVAAAAPSASAPSSPTSAECRPVASGPAFDGPKLGASTTKKVGKAGQKAVARAAAGGGGGSGGSITVGPAWGSLGEQHLDAGDRESSLLQADGVGALEDVDEDWVKA